MGRAPRSQRTLLYIAERSSAASVSRDYISRISHDPIEDRKEWGRWILFAKIFSKESENRRDFSRAGWSFGGRECKVSGPNLG